MINAEVLELKKRFRKDKASFYRVAGCYVNEKKEKVYTFNKQFLNLPDDEMFKYLEIVTKTLSGKINNNLLNIEFPIEEEKDDGAQSQLYELRNSEADDEELLNDLYDKIIASYQHLNHYLITLFFDKYDVPVKTADKQKLDDSEEVFHYIICSICPVELTQPNLGYIDHDTGLAITSRNWVVQPPETGFMYPAFNDRSTDIHSILFYTKNAKLPHTEIVEDMLGCEYLMTSAQKKNMFNNVIATQLDDMPTDEIVNIIIDSEYRLQQMIDAHKAEHGETAALRIKKSILQELVEDVAIPDEKKDGVVTALGEIFEDTNTDASVLVSAGNMRIGEVRAEKKAIAHTLSQTTKELEMYKEKTVSRKYETKNINGMDYMLIPTEKNTTVIDGVEYVLIPVDGGN
jgi:hypothetical protein